MTCDHRYDPLARDPEDRCLVCGEPAAPSPRQDPAEPWRDLVLRLCHAFDLRPKLPELLVARNSQLMNDAFAAREGRKLPSEVVGVGFLPLDPECEPRQDPEPARCEATTRDLATGNETRCRLLAGHDGSHDDGALMWLTRCPACQGVVRAARPSPLPSREEVERAVDVLMASVELDGFHSNEEDTPAACRAALLSLIPYRSDR